MGEHEDHREQEASESSQDATYDATRQELIEMRQDAERLKVVSGTTEPRAGVLLPGEKFRFLITAAVQTSPRQLGEWLEGDGNGFEATDRPVNTSLIDQDHTATFEGRNGFILQPPDTGDRIIAAQPHDFGSSDLERQVVDVSSDELLAQTDPLAYNHLNISAGKLRGVYIRQRETGEDLGIPEANSDLRAFAAEHGLPVVEIRTRPHELHAGSATAEKLPANDGNGLWKIKLPEEGLQRDIDVIQFKPGERPRGFQPSEEGFDLRVQEIDGYGESRFVMNDIPTLKAVLGRLDVLSDLPEDVLPAVVFARDRLGQQIAKLEVQRADH